MGEIRRDYLGTISRAVREVGGLARITVGPPGMQIAMLGIPILLAAVLGAFTLETQLTSIPVHAAITLQPTGALPLRLRRSSPT
jgi:hypothetical protein